MKSKFAVFLFALSVGISATAGPPDNLCYRIYNECVVDPYTTSDCATDLETCLAM